MELEVIGSVETLRNEAYENYSKQMSVYDGRLARVDLRKQGQPMLSCRIESAVHLAGTNSKGELPHMSPQG